MYSFCRIGVSKNASNVFVRFSVSRHFAFIFLSGKARSIFLLSRSIFLLKRSVNTLLFLASPRYVKSLTKTEIFSPVVSRCVFKILRSLPLVAHELMRSFSSMHTKTKTRFIPKTDSPKKVASARGRT